MINSIYVIGRLTKEPEGKETNGVQIANFDIAFDNLAKDENGERTTSFIRVVAFNKLAEIILANLHKGSKILVNGTLQQKNYLKKDGSKASSYEITANSIEFLDSKVKTDEPEASEPAPKFDPYTGKPLEEKKSSKTTKK